MLRRLENIPGESGFTQLGNVRGDNVDSHWTPLTAPGAVEIRAIRSNKHQHSNEEEHEELTNGIRVTTEMRQNLSKTRGA